MPATSGNGTTVAVAVLSVTGAAWADAPLEEGLRLFEAGRYAEAGERFAVSADPDAEALSAIVRATLGGCEDSLSRLSEAATGDSPAARLAGLSLARCAVAAGEFDTALNTLVDLKSKSGPDPDVLYEIARVHLKGWNDAVAAMFAEAPASFRVNQLSAEIFEIQGRFDDAVREYRKAIEKAPATINLHYRLGRALLMASHEPQALEAALEEFHAELGLNPNDAVAEFQVGQILQVLGRPAEATPHFERAVELDGAFPEALIALGKDRASTERTDEAIDLLERALALHPESEPAHYSLMLAYRNAGRRADAERLQEALERLQAPAEGEFNEFLRRIGEAP